jgi:hypothetical protein
MWLELMLCEVHVKLLLVLNTGVVTDVDKL